MKNKLTDLNNHLFEQLERLNDEDLEGEGLDKEIERSKAVTKVAQTIINNGTLILNAKKHVDEWGNRDELPELLTGGNNEKTQLHKKRS